VIRTYLDSGALIAAFREQVSAELLGDDIFSSRSAMLSSVFVRMETIPLAAYNKRHSEVHFYEHFFARSEYLAEPDSLLFLTAEQLGRRYGLHAMDSLHVAAAMRLGAKRMVTTEKATRPLFRVREIEMVRIDTTG